MINEFQTYLTSLRGFSQNTAIAYSKDCKQFAEYQRTRKTNARWSTMTRDDVDAYVLHMVSKGNSGATINRHLASVAALYRYMKRQGYQVENPCKYESRHKLGDAQPKTIPMDDIKAAIRYSAPNVAMMLRLFISTGIRLQELIDIDLQNVDYEKCIIWITGKGRKERAVFMDTETRDALAEYTGGSSKGKPFQNYGQREIRAMVHEALKPFSSARQLSPHAIRHTYATEMAKNGISTDTLSRLLGHNRISTTQKYINLGRKDVHVQYDLFNPLKNN